MTVATEDSASTGSSENFVASEAGTTTLPETVAYVPVLKPGSAIEENFPVAPQIAATAEPDPAAQAAQAAASDAQAQGAAAAAGETPVGSNALPANNPVYVTATDPAAIPLAPKPAKKRSFFASLFAPSEATAAPLVEQEATPKPIVTLASTGPAKKEEVKTASLASGGNGVLDELDALPGVRKTALFEIKRKSGIDDDSDVDLHEDEDFGPIEVASAAGLARLAPNGLITQTESVDVACLKPSLVRVLKTVERHYGKKVMVTSGFRNQERNRRARGAKNSLHMYCAAADVQVPGVSKWELAAYFRTMPGRGGVGTYCHTNSVHIDVGPERDWNWRCRRRKA